MTRPTQAAALASSFIVAIDRFARAALKTSSASSSMFGSLPPNMTSRRCCFPVRLLSLTYLDAHLRYRRRGLL